MSSNSTWEWSYDLSKRSENPKIQLDFTIQSGNPWINVHRQISKCNTCAIFYIPSNSFKLLENLGAPDQIYLMCGKILKIHQKYIFRDFFDVSHFSISWKHVDSENDQQNFMLNFLIYQKNREKKYFFDFWKFYHTSNIHKQTLLNFWLVWESLKGCKKSHKCCILILNP